MMQWCRAGRLTMSKNRPRMRKIPPCVVAVQPVQASSLARDRVLDCKFAGHAQGLWFLLPPGNSAHAACAPRHWPHDLSLTYRHGPPLAPLLDPRVWPGGPVPGTFQPITTGNASQMRCWQGKMGEIRGNKSKKKTANYYSRDPPAVHPSPTDLPHTAPPMGQSRDASTVFLNGCLRLYIKP